MGLCLDAASNLYIADYGNKRVQVLGPHLVFKKEFKCQSGSRGVAILALYMWQLSLGLRALKVIYKALSKSEHRKTIVVIRRPFDKQTVSVKHNERI